MPEEPMTENMGLTDARSRALGSASADEAG
jgi:hypothetical protein